MAFYTAWMFGKYQGLNSFPVPLHRFIFLMPSEPSSPRSSRSSHLFSNCYQNGQKKPRAGVLVPTEFIDSFVKESLSLLLYFN